MSGNTTADGGGPPPPLVLPPGFVVQNFGGPVIGTWVISVLWGVLSSQTYSYFIEYHQDPLWMKGLVVLVWLLAFFHSFASCYAAYHYVILNAFVAEAFIYNFWSLNASVASHMVITFFVYSYFIKLAYQLAKPRWKVPVLLLLGIPLLGHVSTGFVTVEHMVKAKMLAEYAPFSKTWMLFMNVTQVIADIILTFVLCIILGDHKTGFKRTNQMVNTLIVFTVGRGVLTAILAIINMVSIITSPDSLWWGGLEYTVAGMYANSLLVTLNSRRIVRDGLSSKQATTISYTVPLSRIMPNSQRSHDGGLNMDPNSNSDTNTIEGQKVANGIGQDVDRDMDRDGTEGVLVTKHMRVDYTQ